MAGPYIAEGWDALTTADLPTYYTVDGDVTIAGGRFGSSGVRCNEGGSNIGLTLPAELSDFVMGFACFHETAVGNDHLAMLVDGHDFTGGAILTLHVNSDGSIAIRRGATTFGYLVTIGTLVWTSAPGVIHVGAWDTIEWKGTIHASAGTLSLKVNGEVLCTLGPIRTTGDGSSNVITRAFLGCHVHAIRYDDWWLLDQTGARLNDFLGDRTVEAQVAAVGNGTYAELTPSTGSDHGAMVDDATSDGDATYNAGGTVGLRDTYTFPALTRVDSIDGIVALLTVAKDGGGTRAIAGLTRTGGSDFQDATDHYLTTLYATVRVPLPENPDTTDPWTISEANAAELGVKVTV